MIHRRSSAQFRGTPKTPLFEVLQTTRDGPVTAVRAFYCDVMDERARKEFVRFDAVWRKVFPFASHMDFNKDSAEIWIHVPHPRTRKFHNTYGIQLNQWLKFCRRWEILLSPDLPSYLRP